MGIQDIAKYLHENDEIFRSINICDLAPQEGRKVIVVDGDVYIDKCLLKYFTLLLVGGIFEFAESIRTFVRAFQNLGIKLVFIFTDSSRKLTTEELIRTWCNVRLKKQKYKITLLETIKNQQPLTLGNLPTGIFKLQDINCWVISVLREMECEVFCHADDQMTLLASYANDKDCVAILAQSTYLFFFVDLNCSYLPFEFLDLEKMLGKIFDSDLFSSRLGLNKAFFPLLASLLGEGSKLAAHEKYLIRKRIRKHIPSMHEDSRVTLIAAYIRNNYDPRNLENVPDLITAHFPEMFNKILMNYSKFQHLFYVRINCTESTKSDVSTLSDWEKIKIKSKEMSSSGKICSTIPIVIEKLFFQQFHSLEDFEELPPSSLVYRNLRRNMYGILLHESVDPVENLNVSEWCMEMEDQPDCPVEVSPCPVDPTLHPGLLNLWKETSQDEGLKDLKWRLFAKTISPELDHRSLRDLPKSLVVPVAVLRYLYHEEAKYFHDSIYYFVTPRELELLLIVAMTIPFTDLTFMKCLPNYKANIRVIRLSNLFMQGCDIMKMVLQSCGLNLGEKESSICWYFDGKLFQHLYDKSQEASSVFLAGRDKYRDFESIKKLVFNLRTPK